MQVDLLCGYDAFLVALDAKHFEDLGDFVPLFGLNNPISLCIRLVNLTAFLWHFHNFISFKLFLLLKDCVMMLVEDAASMNLSALKTFVLFF